MRLIEIALSDGGVRCLYEAVHTSQQPEGSKRWKCEKTSRGGGPAWPPTGSSMTVKWSDNFEDMWKLGTKLGSSSEYVTRDWCYRAFLP